MRARRVNCFEIESLGLTVKVEIAEAGVTLKRGRRAAFVSWFDFFKLAELRGRVLAKDPVSVASKVAFMKKAFREGGKS